MAISDWLSQGERLPRETETEVCGRAVRHRTATDYGEWIALVRRAERAAEAVPASVPPEARELLPDDLETARDLVRSAVLLEGLLCGESAASMTDLLRLARVNGPVYAELAARVLGAAQEQGALAEASEVERSKKN